MSITRDEAKSMLLAGMPPGLESLYDYADGDIGRFFYALGGGWKQAGFDLADTLADEVSPQTMTQKIPDWEAALGLMETVTARTGTTTQRRNQAIGYMRTYGEGFNLDGMRSVAQLFLGYADASQIQILETDRAALKALHTYAGQAFSVTAGNNDGRFVNVLDRPRVSPAGVRVELNFTGSLFTTTFKLTNPAGVSKTWAPGTFGRDFVTTTDVLLFWPEIAGGIIYGDWAFEAWAVGLNIDIHSWSLFVEGLGRNTNGSDGLGASIFEWAVVTDPTLVGPDVDYQGVRNFIPRVKPAHTLGSLARKNTVVGLCAIPDEPETIPNECVPC